MLSIVASSCASPIGRKYVFVSVMMMNWARLKA